jgi:hypothetical protein
MRHLLNGVAIAAVFAIAAPALAQTSAPMTPAAPPAKTAPAMAPAKTMAMPKKPMRMRHMAHRGMMNKGDSMTEDLNRQELARITGGGAPAPMGGPTPPYGGNAPTSGAAGPFAPGGGAAPPPPSAR